MSSVFKAIVLSRTALRPQGSPPSHGRGSRHSAPRTGFKRHRGGIVAAVAIAIAVTVLAVVASVA